VKGGRGSWGDRRNDRNAGEREGETKANEAQKVIIERLLCE
jgi:hypothetical protein